MKTFLLWVLVVLWFITENHYFGWNADPHSPAELLADGIEFILVAIAIFAT